MRSHLTTKGRSFRMAYCLSLAILLLATAAFPQEQGSEYPLVGIVGREKPEEIPAFIAWREFFWSVDTWDLNSGLDAYIRQNQANLDEALNQSKHGAELFRVLAAKSIDASRDIKRLRNRMMELVEARKQGVLEDDEQFREFARDLTRKQVSTLAENCRLLKQALLEVDPVIGPVVWDRLVHFVNTEVKASIAMSINFTPEVIEHFQILSEFDDAMIGIQ